MLKCHFTSLYVTLGFCFAVHDVVCAKSLLDIVPIPSLYRQLLSELAKGHFSHCKCL